MPPRPRYNKSDLGDDGGPRKPDPPSEAMLQWDVLSTIHQWRTDLDQELIEQVCNVAATTAFKKHVALACGVRPDLFEFWLNNGMRPDAPPLQQQLSCRFHMIQAFQTSQSLARIQAAGARGDWNADAWIISHRLPEWANRKESSTPDLGIESDCAPPALSVEQREAQMIQAMVEAKRTGEGKLAEAMRKAGVLEAKKLPE